MRKHCSVVDTYDMNLFWLGGGQMCPLVDFLNNSVKKYFIAMKPLDILQLPIVQFLRKFHRNILNNEGWEKTFWD